MPESSQVNAYLTLAGIMFGVIFGGGGVLYAIVTKWLNRRENRALVAKTEQETGKLQQEKEALQKQSANAAEKFKFELIEDAADGLEKLFKQLQDTKIELAEKTDLLRNASIETTNAVLTIQGKDAIIKYQREENQDLAQINSRLEDKNKNLMDHIEKQDQEIRQLRTEFEAFKKEHADCVKKV